MNSLISRRTAFFSLVLLSSLLIVAPSIYQAAKINVWTLDYFQGTYKGEHQVPAAGHPRGEIWQALSALSAQDWQAAIDLLSPLAVQGNKYGMELLGRAFEGAGDYSAAFQAYRHIGNRKGLLRVAATTVQAGDLNTALEAYQAAWEVDPVESTTGYVDFLRNNLNEDETAVAVLRKALSLQAVPRRRMIWYDRLIGLLSSQKRWPEAESVIEEAIREYPKEVKFYVSRGWLFYNSGKGFGTALQKFQYAASINEKSGAGCRAVANLYEREGRYLEADEWYLKAIQREPDQIALHLNRANAVRNSGDPLKAIGLYQEILALFSDHSNVYYDLAWAYHLNQQPQHAVTAIEKARDLGQSIPSIHARAGQIYETIGDKEKATAAYQRALALEPGNSQAKQGLKRLSED